MSVPHLVPPPAIRDQLERLAHWSLAGRVPDAHLLCLLTELAPNLPEEEAAFAYLDLVETVAADDGTDATRAPVDQALDVLEGGKP